MEQHPTHHITGDLEFSVRQLEREIGELTAKIQKKQRHIRGLKKALKSIAQATEEGEVRND